MIDRDTLRQRINQIPDADGEHERYCEECGARVTADPNTGLEYGHMSYCSQRSDDLREYTHDSRRGGGRA